MPFTDQEIANAVEEYNREEIRADAELRRVLNATNDVLIRVCFVADWGAIQNFPFRDRIRMAELLGEEQAILNGACEITLDEWRKNPKIMTTFLGNLPEEVLRPGKNRQLSFWSSYYIIAVVRLSQFGTVRPVKQLKTHIRVGTFQVM